MLSVLDQYNEFLVAIRKDRSGSCPPDRFNIFYNESMIQWKNEQAKVINSNFSRIENISYLRYALDGIERSTITVSTLSGDHKNTEYVKKVDTGVYTFKKPDGATLDRLGNKLPRYWRIGDVAFRVKGNNMTSPSYNSDPLIWIPGKNVVDGVREFNLNNVFSGSNYYKVPFDIAKDMFIFYTNNDLVEVKLIYYMMPQLLFFDKDKYGDVDIATNPNFENGKGSVNTNLSDDTKREIIRSAAALFLENSTNQRYQTFSREDYVRKLNVE